jgi:hypothetical protein
MTGWRGFKDLTAKDAKEEKGAKKEERKEEKKKL